MICKSSSFVTDRLIVEEWHSLSTGDATDPDIASVVAAIFSPPVTQSLPDGWQGQYTTERARRWIEDRDREGATLLVVERSSRTPVGLMIAFESDDESDDDGLGRNVRVGYLLAESAWGQGFATELLKGFVDWCRTVEISSITGGVERGNIASQRVMEKNGFEVLANAKNQGELLYELKL